MPSVTGGTSSSMTYDYVYNYAYSWGESRPIMDTVKKIKAKENRKHTLQKIKKLWEAG